MKATKGEQDTLAQWETSWPADLGHWQPGQAVYLRGRNIFRELAHLSWMGYYLFAITGREFSAQQLQLFEGIWRISTSFPDPRLWNNRVATLASTARSTSCLGVAAGVAVSEAIIFGQCPLLASFKFLTATQEQLAEGEDLAQLIKQRLALKTNGLPGHGKHRQVAKLPGFGRPITHRDERLQPLLELAGQLNLAGGAHLALAQNIEQTLTELNSPLRMNVATLMGALCADQGLNAEEYYHYTILCFTAGIVPCALDARKKPEARFFPLRCKNINYAGPTLRQWNRAKDTSQ